MYVYTEYLEIHHPSTYDMLPLIEELQAHTGLPAVQWLRVMPCCDYFKYVVISSIQLNCM